MVEARPKLLLRLPLLLLPRHLLLRLRRWLLLRLPRRKRSACARRRWCARLPRRRTSISLRSRAPELQAASRRPTFWAILKAELSRLRLHPLLLLLRLPLLRSRPRLLLLLLLQCPAKLSR